MWKEVLVGICLLVAADGYSQGAPDSACNTLVPGHGVDSQSSLSPYTLTPSVASAEPAQRIKVTLGSSDGSPFKGFIVQARDSNNNEVIGTFFTDEHKYLTCGKGFSVSTNRQLLNYCIYIF